MGVLYSFAPGVLPPAIPGPDDIINFYGPPGTMRTISLAEVLRGGGPELERALRGKVAFFGSMNEREFLDTHGVLSSRKPMAGVEIAATVAGNLMDGSFLRHPGAGAFKWMLLAGVLMVYVALSLGVAAVWRAPKLLAALVCWSVVWCVGWAAVSYLAFVRWFVFVPGFWGVVVIAAGAPVIAGVWALVGALARLAPFQQFLGER